MIYKLRKKLEEQRKRFANDRRVEYIVRRYDLEGKVIEDIYFDNAFHAGLLKRALKGARSPMDCSLIRREYEINDAEESIEYISVEKTF